MAYDRNIDLLDLVSDPTGDDEFLMVDRQGVNGRQVRVRARDILGGARPVSPRLAGIGDSITFNAKATTSTQSNTAARGFLAWLPVLTGQKVTHSIADNFGVGGDTTEQMLSRLGAVVDAQPGICTVLGGTNDATAGVDAATTIANLNTIYDALYNAGIIVIALKILPRASVTAPMYGNIHKVNRWIEAQKYTRRRFHVVDATDVLINLGTGVPKSGLMYDETGSNLHPNALGAYLIAKKIQPVIEALFPSRVAPFWHVLDTYSATDNPAGNLLANGLMAGISGSKSNGPTGELANSWACNGVNLPAGTAAALSKVTKADGRTFQQLAVSGTYTVATAANTLDMSTAGTLANVSPGDVIEAMCEVEWDAGATNVCTPYFRLYTTGTGAPLTFCLQAVSPDVMPTEAASGLIYKTQQIVVPAGVTGFGCNLSVLFVASSGTSLTAAATIRFGSASIRKVL